MDVVNPEFRPDRVTDHDARVALQRRVAAAARFVDDGLSPADVPPLSEPVPLETTTSPREESVPIVAGIDQAFTDDEAVSAVVALQGDRVLAISTARAPVRIPYVPGLLAFREAPAIVEAVESLPVDPDLFVVDGSGRIHYRQAGLATHLGVLFDCPALGVAKRLLCGAARPGIEGPLPAGERVPIVADPQVEQLADSRADADWPTIGYALQTRQFEDTDRRHVNPVYVSPGHRVSADTAGDLTLALSPRYKLPEPIRLADSVAGTATADPEG